MSLALKIMIFVVLLVAVTLAALSAVVLQVEYDHLTSEAQQEALGYLRAFTQTADSIDYNSGKSWRGALARSATAAFRDPNVVYVALQDKAGNLLFATQDAGDVAVAINQTHLPPKLWKALKKAGTYSRPAFQVGDEPVIELMALGKGDRVARIGLREESTRIALNKFAGDALKRLLLINSLAVVAAFLLAFFFARSVQNPLRAVQARLLETLGGGPGNGRTGARQDDLKLLVEEAEAVQNLVRSLETKPSEVVGTLSHEFRSPLQAILGYVGLIKQGKAGAISKRTKEYLDAIEESTIRFKSFTDSALDLVRLDKGRLEVARAPFDLVPLLKGAVRLFQPEARYGELELKTHTAPHVWVLGDGDRTYQVLLNLVSNACKFTPDGGVIELSAKVEGEEVHVIVTDTGQGIPHADIERVFHKFYQSKSQRMRGSKGVGLGLTLAKAVIEAQGGRIWIESMAGKGTQVHFTMPKVGNKPA